MYFDRASIVIYNTVRNGKSWPTTKPHLRVPWDLFIFHILLAVAALDHNNGDCFVLVVLSHGSDGYLYAKDGLYSRESLWTQFTADKCPSLAGKPKLFFIQVCNTLVMGQGWMHLAFAAYNSFIVFE